MSISHAVQENGDAIRSAAVGVQRDLFISLASASGIDTTQATQLFDAAASHGVRISSAANTERVAAETQTDADILRTAGQRRINLLWEGTQAGIAISVCFVALFVAASLTLRGGTNETTFNPIWNGFFLIVGFYFSRTNHVKTGGVKIDDDSR